VHWVTIGAPANRLPYSDGVAMKVIRKSIIISQFYPDTRLLQCTGAQFFSM
jgi:hypothetical protein